MKARVFLSIILAVSGLSVCASHLSGAEMYIETISNNRAVVTLVLYRNTGAVLLPSSVSYSAENLDDPTFATTGSASRVDIDMVFYYNNLNYGGFEKHTYRDTLFLLADGMHRFSAPVNARSPVNNANGGSALYIFSEFHHTMGTQVKGLYFKSDPVYSASSQDFRSSNMAGGPQVDSIVYALADPLTDYNTPVSGYVPFFDPNQHPANQTLHIDKYTGALTAKGNNPLAGLYIYAIKAEAYVNGQVVSRIMREASYYPDIDYSTQQQLPVFSKPTPTYSLSSGATGYLVKKGNTLVLDSIECSYPDPVSGPPRSAVKISYTVSDGIKLGQNASLVVDSSSSSFRRFTFSFTPDSALNNTFEVVNFRIADTVSTHDYSFWIYVDGDTTLSYQGAELHAAVDVSGHTQLALSLFHKGNKVLPDDQEVWLEQVGGGQAPVPVQLLRDTVLEVGLYPVPVLRSIYRGSTGTLSSGDYRVFLSACCREADVDNYQQALGNGFYTETTFRVDAGSSAATPLFKQNPILAVPKDSLWQYSFIASDPDADSIYYSLDDVLAAAGAPVAQYVPIPGTGASHNTVVQSAGLWRLQPDVTGKFAYVLTAEAYRAGSLVERTHRDMILHVVDSSTLVLRTSGGIVLNGLPTFSLTGGQPFAFDVVAYTLLHPDSTTGVTMEASGIPFDLPNSNASFAVTNNKQGSGKKGTFTWTPDKNLKGQSFALNIRISDGNMTYDYVALLKVEQSVGQEEPYKQAFKVYPNPTKGEVEVSLPQGGRYQVQVHNTAGRLVFSKEIRTNAVRLNLSLPHGLPAGVYLFRVEGAGFSEVQRLQLSK